MGAGDTGRWFSSLGSWFASLRRSLRAGAALAHGSGSKGLISVPALRDTPGEDVVLSQGYAKRRRDQGFIRGLGLPVGDKSGILRHFSTVRTALKTDTNWSRTMKISSNRWLAALGLVLLGALAATLAGQRMLAARPTAVAVVDIAGVANNLAESKAVEADLQRMREGIEAETARRASEIKSDQDSLEALKKDSAAYAETEEKIIEKIAILQGWQKIKLERMQSDRFIRMEGIYRKVVDAVGRYAEKEGYDVVLVMEPVDSSLGKNLEQLLQSISMRKVVYAVEELNITDEVTQMLNNEFNHP